MVITFCLVMYIGGIANLLLLLKEWDIPFYKPRAVFAIVLWPIWTPCIFVATIFFDGGM